MFNVYVTSENDKIRRTMAVTDAHALTLSSFALASEADLLSAAARRADHVVDTKEIELQLSSVRRRCADVRAGVKNVRDLAAQNVESAEAVVTMAKELFSEAENTFNHASFEVNFATTLSE